MPIFAGCCDAPQLNSRLGRFRSLVPWVVAALLVIGGCAVMTQLVIANEGLR